MNLLDAITTLLDATADMDGRPNIRQARKRLQQRADALRSKRERLRRDNPPICPATRIADLVEGGSVVVNCEREAGHEGWHRTGSCAWQMDPTAS